MARTRHQTVIRVAPKGQAGKQGVAKNSDLKQAAHQGKAAVKSPRTAQSGYTAVPASVATMPPGEGPPMSSTPPSVARGHSKSNRTRKNSTSQGPVSTSSSGASAQAVQPPAAVVAQQGSKRGSRASAKQRGRAGNKKRR
jgi:hypothetical protein